MEEGVRHDLFEAGEEHRVDRVIPWGRDGTYAWMFVQFVQTCLGWCRFRLTMFLMVLVMVVVVMMVIGCDG